MFELRPSVNSAFLTIHHTISKCQWTKSKTNEERSFKKGLQLVDNPGESSPRSLSWISRKAGGSRDSAASRDWVCHVARAPSLRHVASGVLCQLRPGPATHPATLRAAQTEPGKWERIYRENIFFIRYFETSQFLNNICKPFRSLFIVCKTLKSTID